MLFLVEAILLCFFRNPETCQRFHDEDDDNSRDYRPDDGNSKRLHLDQELSAHIEVPSDSAKSLVPKECGKKSSQDAT